MPKWDERHRHNFYSSSPGRWFLCRNSKASDHENADGKYEAQVFYVDANGQKQFVKKAFIDYTAPSHLQSDHYKIRVRRDFHYYS